MRRSHSRLALAVPLLSLVLAFGLTGHSSADVNDFTITSFSADYYLSKDDPQGALTVDEHLSVDFTDYNHGILRALPERYNGQPQHIHIIGVGQDAHNEPYTTYTSNGNEVLKIGDPNETITGEHTYNISYKVVNVIRFTDGNDELDWNANGTQWDQPFLQVQATLHLSDDMQKNVSGLACFTGAYKSTAQDCTEVPDGNGRTVFTTTRQLNAGENMSFRADFPKGTFSPPTFKDWLADNGRLLAELFTAPLLALILAGGYWFKNGKDIKGRGTIIPEYGPPNNLSPLEVDTVANYKLSTGAISATIIDLAIRKYVRIKEADTKKLLGIGKNRNYSLQLINSDYSKLNAYEQQIMNSIFATGEDEVAFASLKNQFYTTAQSLQKLLPADLTKAGYFPRNPTSVGSGLQITGAVLFFGAFGLFGLGPLVAVSILAAGGITYLFASLMPQRTQLGVDAKDAVEGLKLFMNVTEKERIKMLQSPDSPYADKSAAPAHTVDLFEKLLPYAIVLGVENQWAKQFADIYKTPPDWYYGSNWTAFNAAILVGSLNNSMAVMNSSFAPPASSGSGGGGGFSGGGGGGGGGGGW